MADKMILGERYDDYMGFDCDNYDPYDPFATESQADLFAEIAENFCPADAEKITREIIFGASTDAAIQSLFM